MRSATLREVLAPAPGQRRLEISEVTPPPPLAWNPSLWAGIRFGPSSGGLGPSAAGRAVAALCLHLTLNSLGTAHGPSHGSVTAQRDRNPRAHLVGRRAPPSPDTLPPRRLPAPPGPSARGSVSRGCPGRAGRHGPSASRRRRGTAVAAPAQAGASRGAGEGLPLLCARGLRIARRDFPERPRAGLPRPTREAVRSRRDAGTSEIMRIIDSPFWPSRWARKHAGELQTVVL